MTQPPAAAPFPAPVPAYRTSKAAVISLITGLLFCVPTFGLIALLCGFIGISHTSNPAVKGRGMAVFGLILGIIGTLTTIGEGVAGGVIYMGYRTVIAALETGATTTSQDAIAQLAAGNLEPVMAKCTSNVSPTDLQNIHDQIKDLGSLKSFTMTDSKIHRTGNTYSLDLTGNATFQAGAKTFKLTFLPTEGDVKIDSISAE